MKHIPHLGACAALAFSASLLATGLAAHAHGDDDHGQMAQKPSGPAADADAAALSDGEIRKVDKSAKKLTIKHGEIKNLDMPGMTMLFQVKDGAMLDRVKPGDVVKFRVERLGGALVVTELLVSP